MLGNNCIPSTLPDAIPLALLTLIQSVQLMYDCLSLTNWKIEALGGNELSKVSEPQCSSPKAKKILSTLWIKVAALDQLMCVYMEMLHQVENDMLLFIRFIPTDSKIL